jgi:flagellar motor switch protein FliN/FliY
MDPELEPVDLSDVPSTPDEPFEPPADANLPVPASPVHDVALEALVGGGEGSPGPDDLSLVLDVPVELTVVMGKASMTIGETLAIGTGSIITLSRLVGEPVDLLANGRLIARGEVVAIDEEYGLRVTDVLANPGGAREAA